MVYFIGVLIFFFLFFSWFFLYRALFLVFCFFFNIEGILGFFHFYEVVLSNSNQLIEEPTGISNLVSTNLDFVLSTKPEGSLVQPQ